MGVVRKVPAAEQDLVEIGVYIAQDSLVNADRFIDAIERECQKLADSPFLLGRSCEGLHADLRRHNFKHYAIIYRPVSGGIDLVGVFHGSRQLEAIFECLNERL
ncbi:MAG TPA: type II toxin-antitoxin system RelE/ParE family toxin [Thermoanaerobaculia bacterium]|nr:type II toxin-antitoxin system RelE/ParE family toxin [Thermoanaerobaculia bacterium]